MPANCLSGIGKQGYIKLQKNRINTIGDFAKLMLIGFGVPFLFQCLCCKNKCFGEVVDIPKQKKILKA